MKKHPAICCVANGFLLTLPIPIPDEEKKIKFLFSHFFVVPQKVL